MSTTREQKEFKVVIQVIDEKGNDLRRNYNYKQDTDYTAEVQDLIETHLEAENL